MKIINGKYHYQVKDLIEDLRQFPQESVLFAIFQDKALKSNKRPIYKIVETAEACEVYIYLGDNSQ